MGGSRQLTWEHMAHRKLRQAICSHKTKTQAHGQQINHQPCAKQDTNTQLMRILISHVFTQDMTTWKHTANEKHKLRATPQNTTHVDRRARGWANSRPHTHTTRRNMERECPNTVTKLKLKTWVPGSKHHAPTRHIQGTQMKVRTARMKTGHAGSVRALSQNHE